jgi:hypothetical protein
MAAQALQEERVSFGTFVESFGTSVSARCNPLHDVDAQGLSCAGFVTTYVVMHPCVPTCSSHTVRLVWQVKSLQTVRLCCLCVHADGHLTISCTSVSLPHCTAQSLMTVTDHGDDTTLCISVSMQGC